MRAFAQGVRTMLAVTWFFAIVYVTYLCTYLAPTHDLRRWGANTFWLLVQFGQVWPGEGRMHGLVKAGRVLEYQPADTALSS